MEHAKTSCNAENQPDKQVVAETASLQPQSKTVPTSSATAAAKELTPDEQMALYEEHLKDTDWGHRPC